MSQTISIKQKSTSYQKYKDKSLILNLNIQKSPMRSDFFESNHANYKAPQSGLHFTSFYFIFM